MWDVFNPTIAQRQKSNPPSSKPQSSTGSSKNTTTKLPPLVLNKSSSNVIQNSQHQIETQELLQNFSQSQIHLPQSINLVGKGDTQLIDLQSRIRQIQINFFDLKASLQRRISRVSQELPSRLQRESKISQQRTSSLLKQNQSNILSQQDALLIVKESVKVHFQDFNHRIIELSGKNEQLNQRANALQKDSERIQRLVSSSTAISQKGLSYRENAGSTIGDAGGTNNGSGIALELQIVSLKQALNEQKRVNKNQIQDLMQKNRDTRQQLHNQIKQINSIISEERNTNKKGQNFVEHQSQQRDIQISEKYRAENSQLLNKLQIMQKAHDEQMKHNEKEKSQMYDWMQEKIKSLSSQILREERGKIQRESVMYEQFRDGFSTVNQMLSNHKDEGKFNMSKTEFLLTDAIQQLNQQLDLFRKASISRLERCQLSDREFRSILSESQVAMAKQNQTIHQSMQNQFQRFQQMVAALENRSNDIEQQLGTRITTIDDGLHKWKKQFQAKNQQKLVELQNAIKQTISYIGKANEESKSRDQYLGEEIKGFQKQFDATVHQIRGKIEGDDLAVEERVSKMSTHLFQKISDVVAQKEASLSQLSSSLSDQVKADTQEQLLQLQNKIGKTISKLKIELRQDLKQRSLMIQGGAQAFALSIEKRLKGEVNQLSDLTSKLRSEMLLSIKKQETELEKQIKIRSLHDQELKNDLRKRIQEQKKSLRELIKEGDESVFTRSKNSQQLLKDQLNASISTSILQSKAERMKLSDQISALISMKTKQLNLIITEKVTDQHKEMISKFNEMIKLHEIQKKVVDQTISRYIESLKAFTKASISEQKAQREAKNQQILHLTSTRIDKLKQALTNSLESRVQELKAQLRLQGDAFEAKLTSIELMTKQEIGSMSQSLETFKAQNLQQIQKLTERANHLHEKSNQLSEDLSALKLEIGQQAVQLEGELRQNSLRSLINELIERDDQKKKGIREIENEIKQAYGRIEEVRELMQNDIDHAIKKIIGDDNENEEGENGRGLKGQIQNISTKIMELRSEVNEKLNTQDFKMEEFDQKIQKVDQSNKKKKQSEENEESKLLGQINSLKKDIQLINAKQLKEMGEKLETIENRIKSIQDQKEEGSE